MSDFLISLSAQLWHNLCVVEMKSVLTCCHRCPHLSKPLSPPWVEAIIWQCFSCFWSFLLIVHCGMWNSSNLLSSHSQAFVQLNIVLCRLFLCCIFVLVLLLVLLRLHLRPICPSHSFGILFGSVLCSCIITWGGHNMPLSIIHASPKVMICRVSLMSLAGFLKVSTTTSSSTLPCQSCF